MEQILRRVAIVGNHPPRRCGIATFTSDLRQSIQALSPTIETITLAMSDPGHVHDYGKEVAIEIARDKPGAYTAAADFLNQADIDVVSLQHEFGIFGGPAGDLILSFLRRLRMPVVTTLHTVLTNPDLEQRRVMDELIARSARLIVMARKGAEILSSTYGVRADKIAVIAHGIPDVVLPAPQAARAALGLPVERPTLLTFGLLSPGKGIEGMIEALPAITERHPEVNYLVLGATHPHLKRLDGERYRDGLALLAAELGVAKNVSFLDRFVELDDLVQYIAACDVYVTPYLNEAQITSGTLAYSSGLGRPVVSTPYWHATEILANGVGALVPFAQPHALANAILALLDNPAERAAMAQRAFEAGRTMTWAATAERYRAVFARAREEHRHARGTLATLPRASAAPGLPAIETAHLAAISDDTGLLQHAALSLPARDHGYCIDDNVRGILFLAELQRVRPLTRLEQRLLTSYCAFTDHGWRPDAGCFRNFMGYDRRWLDEVGSPDAQGRAVWALAALAGQGSTRHLGQWATTLAFRAAPGLVCSPSPRAWAYGLLGLNPLLVRFEGHRELEATRATLSEKMHRRLTDCTGSGWQWFEDELSYDNARLPQAMFETGVALGRGDLVENGLLALDWLMAHQIAPEGHFRPIGTDSFGRYRLPPLPFDQQPLEANAAVAACLSAAQITGEARYADQAASAFAWFLGENDLHTPVAEVEVGACFDGLHFDRRNGNQGAESTLAYLLALGDMHAAARNVTETARPQRVQSTGRN